MVRGYLDSQKCVRVFGVPPIRIHQCIMESVYGNQKDNQLLNDLTFCKTLPRVWSIIALYSKPISIIPSLDLLCYFSNALGFFYLNFIYFRFGKLK